MATRQCIVISRIPPLTKVRGFLLLGVIEDHMEKISDIDSFMDLVADGTYESYCEKLHLNTDPRIDCSWTKNPPIEQVAA